MRNLYARPSSRLIALAASAFAATPLHGAVHCVGTVEEIRTALTSAAASTGDDEIHIRIGAYGISQQLVYNSSNTGWLFVMGGYYTVGDNPCGGRTASAFSTVLDGNGSSQILGIFYNPTAPSTSSPRLGVDNLSLLNGTGTGFQRGGGLDIGAYGNQYAELWLDNLYLRNNTGYFSGGINAYVNRGLVRVANSLFDDNHAPTSALAHMSITVLATDASHGVMLANNTFVNGNCAVNGNRGCGVGMSVCAGVAAQLSNNVFWNNQFSDLNLEGCLINGLGVGSVALSHNTATVQSGSLVPTISATIPGAPGFASTLNHDFRLRNDSPLLNLGLGPIPVYSFNGFDLDGGLRVRNGALDVGAFENADAMMASGFENSTVP